MLLFYYAFVSMGFNLALSQILHLNNNNNNNNKMKKQKSEPVCHEYTLDFFFLLYILLFLLVFSYCQSYSK